MKLSPNTPEIIRSITPLFLASVGCIIGVCVLSPNIDATKATAALGLASTAIAGAAGLAQSDTKRESDFSVNKDGEKLQIKTPSEQ